MKSTTVHLQTVLSTCTAGLSRVVSRIESNRRRREIDRLKAHLSWEPTERRDGAGPRR